MKTAKLFIALTILAASIGTAGAITLSGPTYTYVFNATSPSVYDGSTITVETAPPGGTDLVIANMLIGWNLFGPGGVTANPMNSVVGPYSIGTADSSGWAGFFNVDLNGPIGPDGSISNRFFTGSSESPGGPGTLDFIDTTAPSATGSWTLAPSGVPDAGSSLQLLGLALGGLGVCRRWIRAQA